MAVPLSLFLPLAVPVVVAWGLASGDPMIETVASRPLRSLDAGYALAVALAALVLCSLAQALGGGSLALAAGRNTLGYVGLTLVGRRLVGALLAPVLSVGFVLLTSLFGNGISREPRWWAWPLAAPDELLPWILAFALLLLGGAVSLGRGDVADIQR
jgi:hypothetical protein